MLQDSPFEWVTPRIAGSLSLLPSGCPCCGDISPSCEYENDPSKPARFSSRSHYPKASWQRYAASRGDGFFSESEPFMFFATPVIRKIARIGLPSNRSYVLLSVVQIHRIALCQIWSFGRRERRERLMDVEVGHGIA